MSQLYPNAPSDSEREDTVQRLVEAHGRGRLDLDEFDRRTVAAYAATTRGDLTATVADLPRQPTIQMGTAYSRAAGAAGTAGQKARAAFNGGGRPGGMPRLLRIALIIAAIWLTLSVILPLAAGAVALAFTIAVFGLIGIGAFQVYRFIKGRVSGSQPHL